jgi:hypothetical protein
MKKSIKALLIIISVIILAIIIIFVFNPFNSRTKIIGSLINSYLSSEIEDYSASDNGDADKVEDDGSSSVDGAVNEGDKNPLLNEEQEKTLKEYGVDVSQLPSEITPEMEACFVNKLGQARTDDIVAGDSPSAMEVIKTRSCLGE